MKRPAPAKVPARASPPTTGWTPAARTGAALVLMWVAVLAVYVPVRQHPDDNAMVGADYARLHLRRVRFAQEALFGPHPHLPAWYPRELMGTPFWSNVQNFPFLPTRLALLPLDPLTAWPVGVTWWCRVPTQAQAGLVDALRRESRVRLCMSVTGPENFLIVMWTASMQDLMRMQGWLETCLGAGVIGDTSVILRTRKRMGWMLHPDGRCTGEIYPPVRTLDDTPAWPTRAE